jgi:hypothetical protein
MKTSSLVRFAVLLLVAALAFGSASVARHPATTARSNRAPADHSLLSQLARAEASAAFARSAPVSVDAARFPF